MLPPLKEAQLRMLFEGLDLLGVGYVREQVKAAVSKLVLPYFDEVDRAVLSLMKNPRFQPKDDAGRDYQRRHLARLGDKEHQRARDNLVALAKTSEYVAGSKED